MPQAFITQHRASELSQFIFRRFLPGFGELQYLLHALQYTLCRKVIVLELRVSLLVGDILQ